MKKQKRVTAEEVKRCFVVSNFIKKPRASKRYLDTLSAKEFDRRLIAAKKKVRSMSLNSLDAHVGERYAKRLEAYNTSEWYVASASPRELGVWKRAGNLPAAWTRNSLADTARHVAGALEHKVPPSPARSRARHALPSLLASPVLLEKTQKEKYLLPIVFAPGTGTNGRRGLLKYKGDIDDGCMRSIALAVAGKKKLRIYFGIPKFPAARVHKSNHRK